jgi:hypothetical protein
MKNRKSNGYYTVSYQQIDILHPYIIVRYGYSLQNGTNYSQMYFFCNKMVVLNFLIFYYKRSIYT